jgi:large subunit ribosomal protein L24
MFKIRKGDTVRVMAGKDRGKDGVVKQVLPETRKAIVEGINLAKKHRRRTQQEQRTGIVQIEMPIQLANLKLICKNCNIPARFGFSILKDNTKARVCKKCNEAI